MARRKPPELIVRSWVEAVTGPAERDVSAMIAPLTMDRWSIAFASISLNPLIDRWKLSSDTTTTLPTAAARPRSPKAQKSLKRICLLRLAASHPVDPNAGSWHGTHKR